MFYVIRSIDKPNSLPIRQDNRPAHIEYLKSCADKLFAAGTILDDNDNMCGSVIIIELVDLAEAEAFAAGDPYAKAGLFKQVTIDRWNKVLP